MPRTTPGSPSLFAVVREGLDAYWDQPSEYHSALDEIERALQAWWEPRRHAGGCYCAACTLARAALGDDS